MQLELRTLLLNSYLVFRTKPLRAFLAILGVIFGVGAVIAMVAIGEGARQEINRKIEAMGANLVRVTALKIPAEKITANIQKSQGLSLRDVQLLQLLFQDLGEEGRIAYSSLVKLEAGELFSKFPETEVIGVSPSKLELSRLQLVQGRSFRKVDFESSKPVLLLGEELYYQLLKSRVAIPGLDLKSQNEPGHLRLNYQYFQVIGVVNEARLDSDSASSEKGKSLRLYVPYSSLRDRISPAQSYSELDEIVLEAKDLYSTIEIKNLVESVLKKTHTGVQDYEVLAPLELLVQAQDTQRILNWVLLCIAGISLLVGGIGIMNIMLANVLERIGEVGLRRAVGARARDILAQFILESVFICAAGGVLGFAFGYLLAHGLSSYAQMSAAFSWDTAWIALLISIFVGLIFGSYPAWQATRISPMEALRSQG